MTTSLHRPRLADNGIGQLLVVAAVLMEFDPPVGSIVENCRCEFACSDRHPGIWLPKQVTNRFGHPVGVKYWTYRCLLGCQPDRSIGYHQ